MPSLLEVRLAATPGTSILRDVEALRQQMLDHGVSQAASVRAAWDEAVSFAVHHITLVIGNNPGKTLEDILARPDIQEVLHAPFARGTSATTHAIQVAWDHGANLGEESAMRELAQVGMHSPIGSYAGDPGLNVLEALLSDARGNGARARQRFLDAILNGRREEIARRLMPLVSDLRNRAYAGITVAETSAFNAHKEALLDQAAREQGVVIRKMWITRFGPGTCAMCASLHGTVVGLAEDFPEGLSFGRVYPAWGPFKGPPRHPNCRCVIVLYRPGIRGQSASAMKRFAVRWWQRHMR